MTRWALLLFCALTIVMAGSAAAQGDPPPFPQAFYGDATIRSQPAPVGTVVEARGAGVKVGIVANPITTTVTGKYGGPTLREGKLGVQGWIPTGAPIYFYLNGERCQVSSDSITWGSSVAFQPGVVSKVHLRVPWARVYYFPFWFAGEELPK
jgi:hypothetical protein